LPGIDQIKTERNCNTCSHEIGEPVGKGGGAAWNVDLMNFIREAVESGNHKGHKSPLFQLRLL